MITGRSDEPDVCPFRSAMFTYILLWLSKTIGQAPAITINKLYFCVKKKKKKGKVKIWGGLPFGGEHMSAVLLLSSPTAPESVGLVHERQLKLFF